MTLRRLLLAVAAASVGALALVVPVADAQTDDEVPFHGDERWQNLDDNEGATWRGMLNTPIPESITELGGRINGWFEYTPSLEHPQSTITSITMSLTVVGDRPPLHPDCPENQTISGENLVVQPGDGQVDPNFPPMVAAFEFNLAMVCNARYRVEITAAAADPPPAVPPPDETPAPDPIPNSLPLTSQPELFLEVAPPEVGQVSAAFDDGVVGITWSPPIGYADAAPADFVGYRVLRALPDRAEFNQAATPGRNTIAFDRLPEGTVGGVRYQVQAVRVSANGDGFVGSHIGATANAGVTIDSPVTTVTQPRRRNPSRSASSRTQPAAPTVDEEFEGTLDFDDFEPGLDEPVLPESAAGIEADDDDGPGQGVLVPAATASVLAAWALHLRYLSRRVGDTI